MKIASFVLAGGLLIASASPVLAQTIYWMPGGPVYGGYYVPSVNGRYDRYPGPGSDRPRHGYPNPFLERMRGGDYRDFNQHRHQPQPARWWDHGDGRRGLRGDDRGRREFGHSDHSRFADRDRRDHDEEGRRDQAHDHDRHRSSATPSHTEPRQPAPQPSGSAPRPR